MAEAAQQRIDFFVIEDSGGRERLKVAARIAEREYLAGRRVLVWSDEPQTLAAFDDQLWTFADKAFVPHETFGAQHAAVAAEDAVPVLLTGGSPDSAALRGFDLLLNLGSDVPPFTASFSRVAEVIDSDAGRRQAGRQRFKRYRDQGLAPVTHTLTGDQLPEIQ